MSTCGPALLCAYIDHRNSSLQALQTLCLFAFVSLLVSISCLQTLWYKRSVSSLLQSCLRNAIISAANAAQPFAAYLCQSSAVSQSHNLFVFATACLLMGGSCCICPPMIQACRSLALGRMEEWGNAYHRLLLPVSRHAQSPCICSVCFTALMLQLLAWP